jgi:hypothetical protein
MAIIKTNSRGPGNGTCFLESEDFCISFFYDPASAFKKALISKFTARRIRISVTPITKALITKAKPDRYGPA